MSKKSLILDKFSLEKEDMSVIGSYSSFFGLLLIATILSYKTIFVAGFEFLYGHSDLLSVQMTVFLMFTIFMLVFVAIPAVPLFSELVHSFRKRKWYLMFMLTFLLLIYGVALVFQFIHTCFDFAGGTVSAVSQLK